MPGSFHCKLAAQHLSLGSVYLQIILVCTAQGTGRQKEKSGKGVSSFQMCDCKTTNCSKRCDECRKKKEKCDGRPPCGRCSRYRIEYRYNDSKVARTRAQHLVSQNAVGSPPEVQSSPSQTVPVGHNARFPDHFSDSEKLQYLEKILEHYVVGKPLSDHEIRDLADSLPKPAEERRTQASASTHSQDQQNIIELASNTVDKETGELCFRRSTFREAHEVASEDMSLNAFAQTLRSAIVEKLPLYIPEVTRATKCLS